MSQTFKTDTRLQNILTAPTLSASDKHQIVGEIQKSTKVQDQNDTIKNFLNTLADNNRLSVLEGVCEKFGTLMSAARGEVEMTITSAAPLDAKVVKQLESAVSKSQYVGQGKKLKVVPKVSPILHYIKLEPSEVQKGGKILTRILRRSTQTSVAVWWWRLVTVPLTSVCPPRWRA